MFGCVGENEKNKKRTLYLKDIATGYDVKKHCYKDLGVMPDELKSTNKVFIEYTKNIIKSFLTGDKNNHKGESHTEIINKLNKTFKELYKKNEETITKINEIFKNYGVDLEYSFFYDSDRFSFSDIYKQGNVKEKFNNYSEIFNYINALRNQCFKICKFSEAMRKKNKDSSKDFILETNEVRVKANINFLLQNEIKFLELITYIEKAYEDFFDERKVKAFLRQANNNFDDRWHSEDNISYYEFISKTMKKDYIRQEVAKSLKDILEVIMNAYEEFLYGESGYNSKGNLKFYDDFYKNTLEKINKKLDSIYLAYGINRNAEKK